MPDYDPGNSMDIDGLDCGPGLTLEKAQHGRPDPLAGSPTGTLDRHQFQGAGLFHKPNTTQSSPVHTHTLLPPLFGSETELGQQYSGGPETLRVLQMAPNSSWGQMGLTSEADVERGAASRNPGVDSHTGDLHTGDSHIADSHIADSHMADSHTSDLHTGNSHPGGTHTLRPSDSHTGKTPPQPRQFCPRSLLLSKAMLESDSFTVYSNFAFSRGTTVHSIIALKESQGFIFNQDLFATPYQQLRTVLREKRNRALSMSKKRLKSHSHSDGVSMHMSPKQRRHTSHEPRRFSAYSGFAAFANRSLDSAIEELPDAESSQLSSMSCSPGKANTRGLLDSDDYTEDDDYDEHDSGLLYLHYSHRGLASVPVIEIVVSDDE